MIEKTREPLSRECKNPGFDDRWTCPGCYEDLPTQQEGDFTCDACERKVRCWVDSQPVAVAELIDP